MPSPELGGGARAAAGDAGGGLRQYAATREAARAAFAKSWRRE